MFSVSSFPSSRKRLYLKICSRAQAILDLSFCFYFSFCLCTTRIFCPFLNILRSRNPCTFRSIFFFQLLVFFFLGALRSFSGARKIWHMPHVSQSVCKYRNTFDFFSQKFLSRILHNSFSKPASPKQFCRICNHI